jgi:transposase
VVKSIASTVGIDVSKDELVVNVDGRRAGGFANTEEGLGKMRCIIPPGSQVHLEASGGYDRLARRLLAEWGFVVHLHNARKVRRMADGMGFLAKNDAMDARALVQVGPLIKSKPAKSATQEALCDISRMVKCLTDQITTAKLRMGTSQLPSVCVKGYEAMIKSAKKQIGLLEKAYRELVAMSEFLNRFELADSVRGIGAATARVISCELPKDIEHFTTKQISSYAGLAPMDDSSGKHDGPKQIGRGNVHLKAAMYMPAIWAIGSEDWARSLYARLKQHGKTHDQAIVPIMRKLLVTVIAVIKRGTAYEADPPRKNGIK